MNHPIFGKLTSSKSKDARESKGRYSFGIEANNRDKNRETQYSKVHKCPMCSGNHILPRCNRFQKESVEGRIKFARKSGLCFNCLLQGHMVKSCPKSSFCKVTGCEVKHSTYLHSKPNVSVADKSCGPDGSYVPPNIKEYRNSDNHEIPKNGTNAQIDVIGAGVSNISLPLVPVKVKCAQTSKVVKTYAFLDSGSNTTFCTTELLNQLVVQGRETALSLTTLHQEDDLIKTSVISLEVFDLEENNMVELPTVFSTERLPISESSIPSKEDIKKWSHLEDVKLQSINAPVGLLIGNDVPRALEPTEVRRCDGKGPYAVKTILGWTINGPLGRNRTSRRCTNFIRSDPGLDDQFKKFCDMEFNDAAVESRLEMSVEDSRALGIMEGSAQLKNGHYEISLPWRNCPVDLPNNRPLAEHRLNHLKKRLVKDPNLFAKYADVMDELVKKGYSRKVPENLINQPQQPLWYLPHHPVLNPNKPDKVRVVFDCAAKYRGTSLNDQLLQGPDLTNSLVGVLLRF